MARHLVAFAAFFMQAEPPAFAMLELVSDLHCDRGADPSEAVNHDPNQCAIPQPIKVLLSIESRSFTRLLRREHRRLTPFDHVPGSAHRGRRVDLQNAASGQILEQLANSGQMLFDGRLAGSVAKLFDVGGDADGFDVRESQAALVAPVEELLYRARVGDARVAACGCWR